MVFGDTAGGRPEFGNRAGVERFAPLRTRGWCESLHPPGLSGAKYLTPLGGMTEFPLRREAWDAARRGLGLAWFARGLTAGRLVQLPSKPNAVRRGTRPGEGWVQRGSPAASRPVGLCSCRPIPTPSRETHRSERSGQNRLDHVAVDVGEATLDAVVVEGQPGVIEAEEVQDRGV